MKVSLVAFRFSENKAVVECHKRGKKILNKDAGKMVRFVSLLLFHTYTHTHTHARALLLCPLLALELCVGLLLIGFRLQR